MNLSIDFCNYSSLRREGNIRWCQRLLDYLKGSVDYGSDIVTLLFVDDQRTELKSHKLKGILELPKENNLIHSFTTFDVLLSVLIAYIQLVLLTPWKLRKDSQRWSWFRFLFPRSSGSCEASYTFRILLVILCWILSDRESLLFLPWFSLLARLSPIWGVLDVRGDVERALVHDYRLIRCFNYPISFQFIIKRLIV